MIDAGPRSASAWVSLTMASFRSSSQPENLLAVVEVVQEGRGGPLMEHCAMLQREDAVRECQHQVQVVLDDEDRQPAAQAVEHGEELDRKSTRLNSSH